MRKPLILGALLLLAMSTSVLAQERPFHLEGSTKVLGNPFAPEGAGMDGAGTATHLGSWTNVGTMFFDASGGPPFAATGFVHFTAADGDHLDAVLTGTLDASLTAAATYTFVGGTGRFANATGSGTLNGQLNPFDGTLTYSVVGTINY